MATRRRSRIFRLGACVAIGLLLAAPVYVGLAKSGLIRSPFFPRADGDLELARSDRPGLRVLFVGNSFTYYNEMPAMVGELAAGDRGAEPVYVVEYTAPNWELRGASRDDGLAELISSVDWDFVVLQDVSYYLASSDWVQSTYPYALALDRQVRLTGSRTMLFMTWGYKEGEYSGDSYAFMQDRLALGYEELADVLSARMAPVGLAWADVREARPDIELWKRDGRHPSRSGSYLAACVFYAVLAGRDPAWSDFNPGLDPAEAMFLQDVAGDVALVQREADVQGALPGDGLP